jgi:hypothetical protein
MKNTEVLLSPLARRQNNRYGRDFYSRLTGFGRIDNGFAFSNFGLGRLREAMSSFVIVSFIDSNDFFENIILYSSKESANQILNSEDLTVARVQEAIEKNML